jgi:hypothetical protein
MGVRPLLVLWGVIAIGSALLLASPRTPEAVHELLPWTARIGPAEGIPGQIGGPWPGGVISYHDATGNQGWAVQQAVRAWNESGAQVRFVAASREEAALIVESRPGGECGHAHATVGYTPQARVVVFARAPTQQCNALSASRALAHELGHVLGLQHTSHVCAAMNPSGTYGGGDACPPSRPWEWRCRLLEPHDVAAAVALYGGRAAAPREPATCPVYPALAAPAGLRLVRDRSTPTQLAIGFRRPPDVARPAFLHAGGEPAYLYSYELGTCPAEPSSPRYRWSVPAGGEEVVRRPILGGGAHCFRVWASDPVGRPSDAPAELRVDVRR